MRSIPRRRGAALAIALAASASGALVACNFIVDAGSYSVGNSAGSDASTDGSSPIDTGTTPVDSSAVDSGTPGDTGSVVDTGVAADGPVVCGQGLPTTSASFKQLLTTCVLAASCNPVTFSATISYCMSNDFLHSASTLSCLTTATDCDTVQSCLGSRVPTLTQCPSDTTPAYCTDAGIGVNCGANGGLVSTYDCKVLGGTCGLYTTDAGTGAGCKLFSGCTETDPSQSYCSSNELYSCYGNQAFGQSCGSTQTCIEDPFNGTGCYFNAPACNYQGIDSYTCSGNTVVLCTEENDNGVQFSYGCAAAGLSCNGNIDGMGNAGCLAPGCTGSDVTNCAETCSGLMATVCVGGAPFTFDCAQIGTPGTFTGCTTTDDGTGFVYATCQ